MLEEEIKHNDTQRVKEELQRTFSALGFSHIYCLFLVAKYKSFLHDDNIQKRESCRVS